MAKVAKTKHSGTYKNLVGATNYYKAVLQNLQNLQNCLLTKLTMCNMY